MAQRDQYQKKPEAACQELEAVTTADALQMAGSLSGKSSRNGNSISQLEPSDQIVISMTDKRSPPPKRRLPDGDAPIVNRGSPSKSFRQPGEGALGQKLDPRLESALNLSDAPTTNARSPRVLDPSGSLCYNWSMVVSFAFLYNFWSLSYRFAFREIDFDTVAFWFALDYSADLIYILDVVINFRTGYLEDGVLQRNIDKIGQHYRECIQFYLDCFCLLPLDILYLSIGFNSILRCTRLVKIYKFWSYADRTERHTNYPNVFRTFTLVHYILVIFHWNACLFHMISKNRILDIENLYKINDNRCEDILCQYLHAFYWSTLSLTIIGDLPKPRTKGEYFYIILELFFGLFLFASVLGHVANIVTNVSAARKEFQGAIKEKRFNWRDTLIFKYTNLSSSSSTLNLNARCESREIAKLDTVKTFMRMRRVSDELQNKVIRWFDYLWVTQKSSDEERSVACLPDRLKAEIAIHVHLDTLKRVDIFQNTEAGFLCELVLRLKPVLFSPGDYVCRKNEVGHEMYIVSKGILEVATDGGKQVLATLKAGSYFGEISVLNVGLAGNKRTASVRSVGYSDLFCLNKQDLWDVLKNYPNAEARIRARAEERLSKLKINHNTHHSNNDHNQQKQRSQPLPVPPTTSIYSKLERPATSRWPPCYGGGCTVSGHHRRRVCSAGSRYKSQLMRRHQLNQVVPDIYQLPSSSPPPLVGQLATPLHRCVRHPHGGRIPRQNKIMTNNEEGGDDEGEDEDCMSWNGGDRFKEDHHQQQLSPGECANDVDSAEQQWPNNTGLIDGKMNVQQPRGSDNNRTSTKERDHIVTRPGRPTGDFSSPNNNNEPPPKAEPLPGADSGRSRPSLTSGVRSNSVECTGAAVEVIPSAAASWRRQQSAATDPTQGQLLSYLGGGDRWPAPWAKDYGADGCCNCRHPIEMGNSAATIVNQNDGSFSCHRPRRRSRRKRHQVIRDCSCFHAAGDLPISEPSRSPSRLRDQSPREQQEQQPTTIYQAGPTLWVQTTNSGHQTQMPQYIQVPLVATPSPFAAEISSDVGDANKLKQNPATSCFQMVPVPVQLNQAAGTIQSVSIPRQLDIQHQQHQVSSRDPRLPVAVSPNLLLVETRPLKLSNSSQSVLGPWLYLQQQQVTEGEVERPASGCGGETSMAGGLDQEN